ncbi:hypothetical protein LTR56_005577 [Elasticomyces elasticus]|nr:hypothetical protein LTR22_017164 [Elasticomyces elasticus]KAK3651769.1 hypothetical protein LTR56_005577 [Elasticomyces elasticus]KAK4913325.1 hypothetical protein LTR49_018306 [Elasticomyces elasticus]KAK5769131.1 hypothetical protein LTS12_000482 [Elasticomyces elasticus]
MAKLTLFNIGICLVVALGSFGYGFGFGAFITVIGVPGFYAYFELDPTSAYTASIIGAINSVFAAGAALGALTQGWLGDWLGRKKALAVAGTWALIGAALTTASVSITMLLVVRILQGFGLGMIIALVPLYITEVSPPHRRGIMTGLTCLSFGLGYVGCAFVSLGTYYSTNLTLQWRIPLETPRYLSWVGKNDEAWAVIQQIHRDPNDPTDTAAHAEYTQIIRQVAFDKTQKSGYIQMFTRPSWRRRSLLAMFLMFASQATGVNSIAYYLVVIFPTLGLTGSASLITYAVYAVVGTVAAFVAIFSIDAFGRRTLFLVGFPILALDLLAEALLQWKFLATTDKAGNGACVAIIFLFIVLFQFIDGPSFVWSSEVFPTNIRAKGIGLTMFAYFVGFVTFSAPGPLGFKKIQWHMYLIYMSLCLVSWVLVYFFIPETRRLPLEEIGALFGEEVMIHLTNDGLGIVEKEILEQDISPGNAATQKKEVGNAVHKEFLSA